MWVGIIGPLCVRDGDRQISLAAGANRVVSLDELADSVWGGHPPRSAEATLRNYVKRLRHALGPTAAGRLATQGAGYLIRLHDAESDLALFEDLCRQGGAAVREDDWPRARTVLTRALRLWRGTPLLDVPSQVLRDEAVPRLEQVRLQALEDRIEADLRLGHHDRLVPELTDMAAAHPLRERFHAQLMLALTRTGRQAEALRAYRQIRRELVSELAVEPGPQLQELHQQILAGDPALAAPPHREADTPAAGRHPLTDVPRQLPASVRHFTGRAEQLETLTNRLADTGQAAGAVIISAIGGTAGVGKTALALYWAHRVADRFPDGQLYVNLRGYDAGRSVAATDALAGFLRALGVADHDITPALPERAAQYRSLLAGRRMLVVLDNAREVEQVRPLLPGTDRCVAVVTSRDSLAGLVVRDGAVRLDLDVLPRSDAVALLHALIGDRVAAEPATAGTLADRCCRLPLAVRIAAELAAARPYTPLAVLVDELADQHRRLDLLDAGDDVHAALRDVFSWSYRHLATSEARTFRLLGWHPGTEFERYACAALTGTDLEQADRALGRLAQAHLIHPTGADRYGMHDLLREYARQLAATEDEQPQRRTALTGLFDHYLFAASIAMDTLYPAESSRRPHVPRPAGPVPSLADEAAARAWLGAEVANLVAAAGYAAGSGWPDHTTRLAATLFRHLDTSGLDREAAIVHEYARRAAEETGDREAGATASNNLGVLDLRRGRYRPAAEHFHRVLAATRAGGDRTGEIRALGNLGLVELRRGRYRRAADHFHQALPLVRLLGDQVAEARMLANLGGVALRLGHYERAAAYFQRSRSLYQQAGDRGEEAYALANLGFADLLSGRCQQAVTRLNQALAVFRDTSDPAGEVDVLSRLGRVALRLGRYEQATDHLGQALVMSREHRYPDAEAEVLNILGAVSLAAGRPTLALNQHTTALALAEQFADDYERAGAHHGLARAHAATGDGNQADHHRRAALTLYTRLGTPEAEQVRRWVPGGPDLAPV
jgi:DNA-binding SARP family transcriptional activator/tetratricopeptide (TPR) repeat protein